MNNALIAAVVGIREQGRPIGRQRPDVDREAVILGSDEAPIGIVMDAGLVVSPISISVNSQKSSQLLAFYSYFLNISQTFFLILASLHLETILNLEKSHWFSEILPNLEKSHKCNKILSILLNVMEFQQSCTDV